MQKPNFGFDFDNFQNDLTEEEANKADRGNKSWIKRYEGPLTITRMALKPKKNGPKTGSPAEKFETSEKDPAFFKVVVEVETPEGETALNHYMWSPNKFRYGTGDKATPFPWVELRKLMDAVGMVHISLQPSEIEGARKLIKKYFGSIDFETGEFPLWAGLQFHGKYDYTIGEFHSEKDGGAKPFFVADHDGKEAIFPSVKLLNDESEYEYFTNIPIRAETFDKLKSIAGANQINLSGVKLKVLKPIEDANTELLARFDAPTAGPVPTPVAPKPVVNDAHSLVEKPKNEPKQEAADEDFPF